MQEFEAFLAKQEAKYAAIRAVEARIRQDGLKHDPALINRNGCVSVAFTHPKQVASRAAKFSVDVANIVPALIYEVRDLHTTVGSFKTVAQFSPTVLHEEVRERLSKLRDVVNRVVSSFPKGLVEINFEEYLTTDTVIMAAGRPNKAFVDIVSMIADRVRGLGMEFYPAIDAHMTVSRFTAPTSPECVGRYLEFLRSAEIPGLSKPALIHVGYSNWDEKSPDSTNGHFVSGRNFEI